MSAEKPLMPGSCRLHGSLVHLAIPRRAPILKLSALPAVLALGTAALCGCLPEDRVRAIQFSPDGRHVAIVTDKKGLVVADLKTSESRLLARYNVSGTVVSWSHDSSSVALVTDVEGSRDIAVAYLDGAFIRVTRSPAREDYPMFNSSENMLYYTSSENGKAELWKASYPASKATTVALAIDGDILAPQLAPSGDKFAFFTVRGLRAIVAVADLKTGKVQELDTGSDALSLVPGPMTWTQDGIRLAVLNNEVNEAVETTSGESAPGWLVTKNASVSMDEISLRSGTSISIVPVDGMSSASEVVAGLELSGLHWVGDAPGRLGFVGEGRLSQRNLSTGQINRLSSPFKVSVPVAGGDGKSVGFAVQGRLLGLVAANLNKLPVIPTFELEDQFLLAEEHFRAGSTSESYRLYEELAASVERTQDPAMARFIYIANLRRLGRTREAVEALEKMLQEKNLPQTPPERFLWKLLGYSYLLELDDTERAHDCFETYVRLSRLEKIALGAAGERDTALNALAILRTGDEELTRRFIAAVQARLNANSTATLNTFKDLLLHAPDFKAVQAEYLGAPEGYEQEVYYFSPSQKSFQLTPREQVSYLETFLALAPDSDQADSVKLDLFVLKIETGDFEKARRLLIEALATASESQPPEGITEVFRNYLETPETQPWLTAAMTEVFLHPLIRPRLEVLAGEGEEGFLMSLAATKLALVAGDPSRARAEADKALSHWIKLDDARRTPDMDTAYARLLVMRAKEAELRQLFSEAAGFYEQAGRHLAESEAGSYEFQAEVKYRAALLRLSVADYPELARQIRSIEQRGGDELVDPLWDKTRLEDAVRAYVRLYDQSAGVVRAIAAYEAAVNLGKLGRGWQARQGFREASGDLSPLFLREKALLELSSVDEYANDPWNAARWLAEAAGLPTTGPEEKMWLSYAIARNHLKIQHKVQEARDALAIIASEKSGTPLGVQARELLMATGQ